MSLWNNNPTTPFTAKPCKWYWNTWWKYIAGKAWLIISISTASKMSRVLNRASNFCGKRRGHGRRWRNCIWSRWGRWLVPPKRALQFKKGINFNYLIELLDDSGKPLFRIFYNAGSGCTGGVGLPPSQMLENIDLLMICGASFKYVDNYPEYLLDKLRPETVFVGHWESFFEPISTQADHPKTAPLNNIPRLMRQIHQYGASHGYPTQVFSAMPMSYSMVFTF